VPLGDAALNVIEQQERSEPNPCRLRPILTEPDPQHH
jgi:hypothetical protein